MGATTVEKAGAQSGPSPQARKEPVTSTTWQEARRPSPRQHRIDPRPNAERSPIPRRQRRTIQDQSPSRSRKRQRSQSKTKIRDIERDSAKKEGKKSKISQTKKQKDKDKKKDKANQANGTQSRTDQDPNHGCPGATILRRGQFGLKKNAGGHRRQHERYFGRAEERTIAEGHKRLHERQKLKTPEKPRARVPWRIETRPRRVGGIRWRN
jgi:hypothetical protein